MFNLHTRTSLVALLITAATAAPAAAQKTPEQIVNDPALAQLTAAQQLASIAQETGGGHLALIGTRSYIRYPDGRLAPLPAAPRRARRI
jgi:hypothetical protein